MISSGFSIKEARKLDVYAELLERLQFITERIQIIQKALGVEYVSSSEDSYTGHVSSFLGKPDSL